MKLHGGGGLVILLAAVLACGVGAGAAAANGLPVYRDGISGLVVPAGEVPVAVTSERLRIHLRFPDAGKGEWEARAQVWASYELENRSEEKQVFEVAFLGSGQGAGTRNWDVRLGGKPLAVRQDPGRFSAGYLPPEFNLDPFTGESYKVSREGPLHAVVFDVALQPRERTFLEVAYEAGCGYDRRRYVNPIYQFTYLLSPGRYWADFGPVEIEVKAPEGAQVASSPPLAYRDGMYVATFTHLPDQDLVLAFASRQGMWWGRYTTRGAMVLTMLLVALAAVALVRWMRAKAARWDRRGLARQALVLAGEAVVLAGAGWFWCAALSRDLLPYPFSVLQPTLTSVIYVAVPLSLLFLATRHFGP